MIASQCNNLKIVQHLVEVGKADVNLTTLVKEDGANTPLGQDPGGRTAMMLAADKGCLMVVEYLVKVGADIHIKDAVSGQ